MFANLSLCASFILSACAFVRRYACSLVCLQPVVPVALMWQLRSSGGKLTCARMLVAICMLCCVAGQGDVLFARLRVCMVSFPMAVCPSVCLNAFYLFAWARICLCESVAVYRYAQPMCLCYCACKSLCLCFFRPFRLCACTPVHRCWCTYSLLCL